MSLIIDNKKIAGLYKAHIIQNSTTENAGIIRIATDEEIKSGLDNLTAVTPKHLATKQNILIAGDGLEILPDGTINNTQTSAEWGKIIGDISTQKDLNTILLTKADTLETAYQIEYIDDILVLKNKNGEELSSVKLTSMPNIDMVTLNYNSSGDLQSIGEITRNNIPKYTWIGTQEEYSQAKLNGVITEFTEVLITDSEPETITPIVSYNAPTKLSELANDMNFVNQNDLQNVKNDLQNRIDTGIDDTNLVHKTGTETIDGFKQFKEQIVIVNDGIKGRIAHKNIDSSLEDGYIEFGDNILVYGKQNIDGELFDEKFNIFHEGNLIAGSNITIIKEGNIYKINSKGDGVDTANTSLSNLDEEGEQKLNNLVANKVDIDLSNISQDGIDVIRRNSNTGLQMFDPILKDHVLTYKESKGLALQGTYVYKDAIAGSRYGYPNFYAKCLEEKDAGTATEVTLGDSVITMYINSNGHQFYDIADKDAVDTWFETYGTAWFYGIDTENERVFLPRNNYFEQLTVDVSEVGQSVKAGLPNITAWHSEINHAYNWNNTGAFTGTFEQTTGGTSSGTDFGNRGYGTMSFDASLSSPIYGNSSTVQPNAVKKLLYICVGNTESQSVITDVVDVTTTKNDTMPLFTGMYFDFTPNNVSWLKGGQQANNAGIYETCYNELVNVLNGETKYGDLKVVDMANMISGVDYSEYWKVNQDEMYFVTPTTISNKALSGAVKGNGMTLGLTNGTNNYGLSANVNALLEATTGNYGTSVGTIPTAEAIFSKTLGITTDPTKSGIIAQQSTAQLYFKIANAVQNLELLDVGKVMEAVADKISRQDCKAYIVDTYVNGNSWYRIYSDGWCEQGGKGYYTNTATEITLLKPYKDINYSVVTNIRDANSSAYQVCILSRTTTAFSWHYYNSFDTGMADWRACGYIA